MEGALVTLAALCARIHWIDVRWRVVLYQDLALLVLLRLALMAMSAHGLAPTSWGGAALIQSALLAGAVAAGIKALAFALGKVTGSDGLGGGDVLLYAAACLFLEPSNLLPFLALSSVGALAGALVALLRRERAFAFAPALVWSLFGVVLITVAAA